MKDLVTKITNAFRFSKKETTLQKFLFINDNFEKNLPQEKTIPVKKFKESIKLCEKDSQDRVDSLDDLINFVSEKISLAQVQLVDCKQVSREQVNFRIQEGSNRRLLLKSISELKIFFQMHELDLKIYRSKTYRGHWVIQLKLNDEEKTQAKRDLESQV